jgi:hypothetical protein
LWQLDVPYSINYYHFLTNTVHLEPHEHALS